MNMKDHILAALQEQFKHWEALLASLSETQRTTAQHPSELSTKDIIAHLMAWQQRSIARLEAANSNREPQFPQWTLAADPDSEGNTDIANARIYETYRDQPWEIVHQSWQAGFQKFLDLGNAISERDLLDSNRYPWLEGHPLAFVLIASYDHHQEHYEKLLAWLERNS
jgi:hypothetical protein